MVGKDDNDFFYALLLGGGYVRQRFFQRGITSSCRWDAVRLTTDDSALYAPPFGRVTVVMLTDTPSLVATPYTGSDDELDLKCCDSCWVTEPTQEVQCYTLSTSVCTVAGGLH